MAYTSPTFIRKSLLTVSAFALSALAVPAAFAAATVTPSKVSSSQKVETVKVAQNNTNRARRGNQAENRNTRRANRGTRSNESSRTRSGNTAVRTAARSNNSNRTVVRVNNNRSRVRQQPVVRTSFRPRQSSYRAPYRSNLGISFNFGSGHSPFRWAASPYSFYSAAYGGYGYYQNRTTCRRVTLEAWRHGHPQLVSVKQCSNPWDGTYIIQGSERLIASRW